MKKTIAILLIPLIAWLIAETGSPAWGAERMTVDRLAAKEFIKLPEGVRFPEGLTVNPHTGEIYAGTFDFAGNNKLLRYSGNGKLLALRDFGATPLLGLAYNPRDDKIYICNTGALVGSQSKIQRIDADFDEGTPVEDVALIPLVGGPPNRTVENPDGSHDVITFGANAPAPNALAFRSDGALFVSDSFQGAIFRIDGPDACPAQCPMATVKHDGMLATAGFPPFGANGIAFDTGEKNLFIANTGDDRILRMNLASGDIDVFAESINGADGIAFDGLGNLWAAANQADELDVLNAKGRVIAKLGDFLGIRADGSPRGLLFPASLAFSGHDVFVTNLALPLTPVSGDEPEEDVRIWTISRMEIPDGFLQRLSR